ncbi:MAG: hypothetical protein M3O70_27820 [Actinomycetota bacterium]|nr:hypothetical protein [Actinomycetota bacterium]
MRRWPTAPARDIARLAAVVFVGLLLAAASSAWACVPQPLVTVTPMAAGPPGAEVTVNGYAISGRAEIRWNALDGPLLATSDGPVFSVPVTIPAVADGLYSLLVLERDPSGALGSTASAAFQVRSQREPPPTPLEATATSTDTVAPSARTPPTSSASVSAGTAVVGGVALLALGAIGGAIARRRSPVEGTKRDTSTPPSS